MNSLRPWNIVDLNWYDTIVMVVTLSISPLFGCLGPVFLSMPRFFLCINSVQCRICRTKRQSKHHLDSCLVVAMWHCCAGTCFLWKQCHNMWVRRTLTMKLLTTNINNTSTTFSTFVVVVIYGRVLVYCRPHYLICGRPIRFCTTWSFSTNNRWRFSPAGRPRFSMYQV